MRNGDGYRRTVGEEEKGEEEERGEGLAQALGKGGREKW